jgi:hypothetical protein
MSKFIELTKVNNAAVTINAEHIAYFEPCRT